MNKKIMILFSVAIMNLIFAFNQKGEIEMKNSDEDAIKHIIEKAYIEGIHTTQDESTVRSGFHKDFQMLVYNENGFERVGIGEWLKRLDKMKEDNPDLWTTKTHYDSLQINVTDYAALIQLDVYKGDTFFSTDFMLLYKYTDGWKIVSKIFSITK